MELTPILKLEIRAKDTDAIVNRALELAEAYQYYVPAKMGTPPRFYTFSEYAHGNIKVPENSTIATARFSAALEQARKELTNDQNA